MTASSNGTPGGLQDEPNGHLESRRRAQEGLSAVKRAVPNLMWTMLLLAALPSFAASPDAALSGTVRDVHGTPQLGALIELMRSDATKMCIRDSPERVQLFVATLAISGRYLGDVLHNTSGVMPDMNASMVSVFGASGSVYAGVKAFKMFTTKTKRKR